MLPYKNSEVIVFVVEMNDRSFSLLFSLFTSHSFCGLFLIESIKPLIISYENFLGFSTKRLLSSIIYEHVSQTCSVFTKGFQLRRTPIKKKRHFDEVKSFVFVTSCNRHMVSLSLRCDLD